ncbi:MAG: sigma-70 family RNA polymerase sigma factor [Phycisphaera sp.]|nr:MAG: sigma-70 family RNA polymerase sigma factor [Phycisphaera sp.]
MLVVSRQIPERGQPGDGDSEGIDALVAQAAANDESAWVELIGLYSRRVYALSRSRLHDPHVAEEITQSVFVTVFQQLTSGRYQAENRFEAWLFRIAMNRVRDHIRRTSRLPTHNSEKANLETPSASGWLQNGDETDRLRGAIDSLPDSDQEILALRHQAGMEFKAIAAMLDEPVGTLLARHHRALGKLRKLLDPASATESAS